MFVEKIQNIFSRKKAPVYGSGIRPTKIRNIQTIPVNFDPVAPLIRTVEMPVQ